MLPVHPKGKEPTKQVQMKKSNGLPWILTGLVLVAVACVAVALLALILLQPNDRDNADPAKREEMISLTLSWGRLAPFPKSARELSVRTEGSRFTRTFRLHFDASEDEIRKWIADSPGLREAVIHSTPDGKQKYSISPGGGANYAEAIIDVETGQVDVTVSWS